MENTKKYMLMRKFMLFALIFVVGGIFGFVYEELFYRIDYGYWVKRGSTFGPWIPIYGIGAILIVSVTRPLLKRPFLVFIVSAAICGFVEYATGFVLFRFFDLRLWNYNTEIWNWGDLDGYICLRSVLFFGLSALLLQYIIVPELNAIVRRCATKLQCIALLTPSILFLADIIIYDLCHVANISI